MRCVLIGIEGEGVGLRIGQCGCGLECIDGRCYDYQGLAIASDFLFVMAYDLRSQIYDLQDCIASANSPIARVDAGLT